MGLNQTSVCSDDDHILKIRRDLLTEITNGTQALSSDLRKRLEGLPRGIRRQLVNTMHDGNTPLTLACRDKSAEVIEFLIKNCDADIERTGRSSCFQFDVGWDCMTPLGYACVYGNLPVVKCLVRLGANVNAIWVNGNTPLFIPSCTRNLELAKVLVENGANLSQRTFRNQTCLLLATSSAQLCEYFLKKGADVNARDVLGRTALHYAIRNRNSDTVRVLLDHGVDPFLEDLDRTDALRMACFFSRTFWIAEYLMNHVNYTTERLADTHELLGAILFDYSMAMVITIDHWVTAQRLRRSEDNYIRKQPMILPRSAFGYAVEFSSDDELREIIWNGDSMMLQSCVILERQLGIDHWFTLEDLDRKATIYRNNQHYQRCIDTLLLVLQQRFQKNSFLDPETYESARVIVREMVNLFSTPHANYTPRFEDALVVFKTLLSDIIEFRHLLDIRPVYQKQEKQYDFIVECLAYLIHILRCTAETEEHFSLLRSFVGDLIQNDIRTTSQETLLHLCVSKRQTIEKDFYPDNEHTLNIFPQLEVTQLLLECGADVNARDDNKSTPLLIASLPLNYDSEIIRTLIEYGAHLDLPNKSGETTWNLMQENSSNDIVLMDHVSLQCMCANVIVKHNVPNRGLLPRKLKDFVQAHES